MARSRSIGGIYASLSLRDQGFKSGLKNAQKQLAEFGKKAAIGVGVGAAAAGTALVAGTKNTLALGGAIDDLSAVTGLAVADAVRLQKAYELGGLAVEGVGKDIGKMQKAIVGAASGGADPFSELGLSAQELLSLNPAEQFRQIGDAIQKISNPAERTAKAMEIFGKAGAGVTNVFGQFEAAQGFLGEMPAILQEFAGRLAEADDLVNELPNKSKQFFVGFSAGIVDTILPGLEDINAFDFTPLGKRLGDALTAGLKEASIILNTLFDVATGRDSKGAGGGNRYAEAQLAIDLENQLATAMKKRERVLEERERKLNDPTIGVPPLLADPYANFSTKIPDFLKRGPESAADSLPAFGPRAVNEFQARGLSLDGNNTTARTAEKTVTLLGRIDKTLQNIERDKGLKF